MLEFDASNYHGIASPFGLIPVEFNLADPDGHYHVPLVFAPGGYSTYRGTPPSHRPNDNGTWGAVSSPTDLPCELSAPSTGGAGLSIHVIDTARGAGAGGLKGVLYRRSNLEKQGWEVLQPFAANAEGRTDRWLVDEGNLVETEYEIVFATGDYYTAAHFGVGPVPFLSNVRVRLRVADPASHHHIALLLSPWGYSCYRGS